MCPAGHRVLQRVVHHSGRCDLCSVQLGQGATLLCCESCMLDVCSRCIAAQASATRDTAAPVAIPCWPFQLPAATARVQSQRSRTASPLPRMAPWAAAAAAGKVGPVDPVTLASPPRIRHRALSSPPRAMLVPPAGPATGLAGTLWGSARPQPPAPLAAHALTRPATPVAAPAAQPKCPLQTPPEPLQRGYMQPGHTPPILLGRAIVTRSMMQRSASAPPLQFRQSAEVPPVASKSTSKQIFATRGGSSQERRFPRGQGCPSSLQDWQQLEQRCAGSMEVPHPHRPESSPVPPAGPSSDASAEFRDPAMPHANLGHSTLPCTLLGKNVEASSAGNAAPGAYSAATNEKIAARQMMHTSAAAPTSGQQTAPAFPQPGRSSLSCWSVAATASPQQCEACAGSPSPTFGPTAVSASASASTASSPVRRLASPSASLSSPSTVPLHFERWMTSAQGDRVEALPTHAIQSRVALADISAGLGRLKALLDSGGGSAVDVSAELGRLQELVAGGSQGVPSLPSLSAPPAAALAAASTPAPMSMPELGQNRQKSAAIASPSRQHLWSDVGVTISPLASASTFAERPGDESLNCFSAGHTAGEHDRSPLAMRSQDTVDPSIASSRTESMQSFSCGDEQNSVTAKPSLNDSDGRVAGFLPTAGTQAQSAALLCGCALAPRVGQVDSEEGPVVVRGLRSHTPPPGVPPLRSEAAAREWATIVHSMASPVRQSGPSSGQRTALALEERLAGLRQQVQSVEAQGESLYRTALAVEDECRHLEVVGTQRVPEVSEATAARNPHSHEAPQRSQTPPLRARQSQVATLQDPPSTVALPMDCYVRRR